MTKISKQASIAFQWAADLSQVCVINSMDVSVINLRLEIDTTYGTFTLYKNSIDFVPNEEPSYTTEEFETLIELLQAVKDLQHELNEKED